MASRYGLQIRAAASADAPGVAELMDRAGRSTDASALAMRLDALRHEPGITLLAVEWGPPSGIVAANWFRTLEADQPVAQISLLLVAPDDRRRGIGRALLKAASQAARAAGCGILRIGAPAQSSSIRAFCLANGFDEAGAVYARPLRKRSEASAAEV